jgi:predicted metal-dependent hydrolase
MLLLARFFTYRRRTRYHTVYKSLAGTAADFAQHKEAARTFITQRLAELNQSYNFTYHRVAIRNSKSRWGSCSELGNLNFHYRLIHLPPHLADYILVHELCHLGELNHSPQFWGLVRQTIPDYKLRQQELKGLEG